jgi:hypothetical protein
MRGRFRLGATVWRAGEHLERAVLLGAAAARSQSHRHRKPPRLSLACPAMALPVAGHSAAKEFAHTADWGRNRIRKKRDDRSCTFPA